MKSIVCPVSNELINERVVRLNSLFVVLFVTGTIFLKMPELLLLLIADFFIRGFTKTSFSPLGTASRFIAQSLKLSSKNIDKAPKIFAARLGFVMTLIMTLFFLFNFHTVGLFIAGMLIFFASLEFVFGICVGCIIYSWVVLPFYK